jgi:high-affinity Fe2+/Pb2+ permease
MGIVVGIVIFLVVLGAAASLIERGAASRLLRPYIGLLLIAALIAGLGVSVGFLFSGLQDFFLITAKIIAVFACAGLCLHLIVIVAKRWL